MAPCTACDCDDGGGGGGGAGGGAGASGVAIVSVSPSGPPRRVTRRCSSKACAAAVTLGSISGTSTFVAFMHRQLREKRLALCVGQTNYMDAPDGLPHARPRVAGQ